MLPVLAQRFVRLVHDFARLRISHDLVVRVALTIDASDLVHPSPEALGEISTGEVLEERPPLTTAPSLRGQRRVDIHGRLDLELRPASA